jgi:hypothetical protein
MNSNSEEARRIFTQLYGASLGGFIVGSMASTDPKWSPGEIAERAFAVATLAFGRSFPDLKQLIERAREEEDEDVGVDLMKEARGE